MENFKPTVDAALNRLVTSEPRVPGVVAMATDRQRNIYEGAAGKRRLDRDADMTTDTVFAIFSTTKAITGTAALQLVEEGKLDLDAPAKNYAPDLGKLEVIEGFTESGDQSRQVAGEFVALALGDAYQRAILGIADEGDGETFARQIDAAVSYGLSWRA
jgi:CubicO group peptidase (beta-lactamase class C family)